MSGGSGTDTLVPGRGTIDTHGQTGMVKDNEDESPQNK